MSLRGFVARALGIAARPPPPVQAAAPVEFEAVVDLGPYNMPAGLDHHTTILAVRAAIEAIPGVGYVNVEHHPGPRGVSVNWLKLSPPGQNDAPDDAAWHSLHELVQRTVLDAMAAIPPGQLPPPSPEPPKYDAIVLKNIERQFARAARKPPEAPWSVPPDHFGAPSKPQAATGFAEGVTFRHFEMPSDIGGMASDIGLETGLAHEIPGASPRVRLSDGAPDSLTDHEMLSSLLSFVLPTDPQDIARAVIARFGSYGAVLAATARALRAVPGLGTHCVAAIKLVHAAALRLSRAQIMDQLVLDNWDKLIAYLNAALARERVEQFRILFLDARNRMVGDEAQARGTVNHTPVYPREVVKRALELKAASLILVHNHPSGDPTPSREDLTMTAQIKEAAALLSLTVQDHVIVGNGKWFSFRREGLL